CIGYLSLRKIKEAGETLDNLEKEAKNKDLLAHRETKSDEPDLAFLFWHRPQGVRELLVSCLRALRGWDSNPDIFISDPDQFYEKVRNEQAPSHTALYTVVARAFNDYTDPNRIDIFNPYRDDPEKDKHLPKTIKSIFLERVNMTIDKSTRKIMDKG